MTSPQPRTDHVHVDLAGLHELLSRLRREPALVERFGDDPEGVCAEHDLPPAVRCAMVDLDLARLLELGANPYLLFFAALELGIPRPEYYDRVRAGGDA
jgi:hypothetical protein